MITVCEKHIKEAINLLDVPHVQSLHPKYGEHSCKFCGELANYKLFYSTPIKSHFSKLSKIQMSRKETNKMLEETGNVTINERVLYKPTFKKM